MRQAFEVFLIGVAFFGGLGLGISALVVTVSAAVRFADRIQGERR